MDMYGNLWVFSVHFSNVLCIVILLNLYPACKKDIKEVPRTVGLRNCSLITTAYYVEKGPFAEAKIGPYELLIFSVACLHIPTLSFHPPLGSLLYISCVLLLQIRDQQQ